jgi:hypothetical protein
MTATRARALTFGLLFLVALLPVALRSGPAVASDDGTWSSLAPDAPAPYARREYAAIYDIQRDRYIIFAGLWWDSDYSRGDFNEVWALTLGPNPSWTQLAVSGSPPGARHSPQWGYDPAQQRLLVFGGYGQHYPGGPNEYLNDVWQLSLDGTPTWTELFPSGTPPAGRLAGAAVYDPFRQRFIGFGGTRGLPVDTWQLDLSGPPAWSSVFPDSVGPPGSYGMASIYDLKRDRMLTFGGSTSDDYFGVRNDVWELSLLGHPFWTNLQPAGTPPSARRSGTAIWDPIRDRMVIFGGWDSGPDSTAFLGDVWALSLFPDLEWAQLAPAGTLPHVRDAQAAVYDPLFDRMVVYGGWGGMSMLHDTQFLTWGLSPVAATMTPSAQAAPTSAQVQWGVQNVTGITAGVYRSQPGTPWRSIGTTASNAGTVNFQDNTVAPGGRYGYKLAVASEQGVTVGGEVWVDVPTSTTGVPGSSVGPVFALDPVRPNPLADRFVVSFALPNADPARLDVLDVSGRVRWSQDVGALGAGAHQLDLGRARDFDPGMYFVRLAQAGRTRVTRAVVVGQRGGVTVR